MDQVLLEHVKAEEKWLKDRLAQLGRIREKIEGRQSGAHGPAHESPALTAQDAPSGAEAYNPA